MIPDLVSGKLLLFSKAYVTAIMHSERIFDRKNFADGIEMLFRLPLVSSNYFGHWKEEYSFKEVWEVVN